MRLICLIFLAAMSVVVVTDCKPLSDDGQKAPCVETEQKHLRKKRFLPFLLPPPPPPPPPPWVLHYQYYQQYQNQLANHAPSININNYNNAYAGNH